MAWVEVSSLPDRGPLRRTTLTVVAREDERQEYQPQTSYGTTTVNVVATRQWEILASLRMDFTTNSAH